jgi:nucleotide-binding universal stress UspA family protein
MSYIIAATDFSAVADNAVYYAAALADALRLDLVIMNAFSMPIMIGDVPTPAALINDAEADAKTKIKEFEKALTAMHPGLAISSLVVYGNAIESLEHYAVAHRRPQFAVMGNSNTAEDSAWLFSTLKTAANELSFPLIAVPPGITFKSPTSMCLALDVEREHAAADLHSISAFCSQLHITLHVLNVQKDVFNRDNIPEVSNAVKKVLAPATPHYHFRYDANIDQTIDQFCTENNIDWLVVIHGKYSLFEGLFHRSHTKALAAIAGIPLLILHEHQS